MSEILKTKSEILFLYESIFSIPNGDPFTGEQRYDEETKKILVSDVRIKRFIRDYLYEKGEEIYLVWNKEEGEDKEKKDKGSGSEYRMKQLKKKYKDITDSMEILKKCIDVRLFGGISTEKNDTVNITGPIQFALLNPSLNKANLRMHQNTTVFPSKAEKNTQGSIGTTTIVPYAVNQIHGWINPYSAKYSGLTEEDVKLMFNALWKSIDFANTRTKSNQNSLLLLQIIYNNPDEKIYGLDNIIKINSDNKQDEEFRSIEDFNFDVQKLFDIVSSADVKIKFYSKHPKIINIFEKKDKFEAMDI